MLIFNATFSRFLESFGVGHVGCKLIISLKALPHNINQGFSNWAQALIPPLGGHGAVLWGPRTEVFTR